MKLRIEISDECTDEVIIRCKAITPEIMQLQNAFATVTGGNNADMLLFLGDAEHFVPVNKILFFETDGDRVAAHTGDRMYYSDKKLYELEKALPHCFMRVSKSVIVNSSLISSIVKGITGNGEVMFYSSVKKTYVSRMYLKQLKELIYETRLSQ